MLHQEVKMVTVQKQKNEPWLSAAIELINKSLDLSKTNYKLLIYVFYELIPNRSLAKLISILYKKDENDVYFEIDAIVINKELRKKLDEIQDIMEKLNENGLNEWLNYNI